MDTTRDYVHRLEAHLQMMSRRMDSLQAELAAANDRNRALAFTQGQAAQEERRTAEREALRRAETIVAEAERRVAQTVAESERRAREVESHAQQRAEQMIAAVNLQLDQLEGQAARELEAAQRRQSEGAPIGESASSGEKSAGEPAGDERQPSKAASSGSRGEGAKAETAMAAEALAVAEAADAEREAIRAQVNDLLRLRETILLSVRQAIETFQEQVGELERPPLPVDPEARNEPGVDSRAGDREAGEKPAPDTPTGPAATGPRVEILIEPVTGFEPATRLERELAELEGAAEVRLRSLEDGIATYEVRGLSADAAAGRATALFAGSEAEALPDGGLRLRLGGAPAPEPDA